MKKTWSVILGVLIIVFFAGEAFGQGGFYLGIQGGYSAQKPSLTDVEFNTNTSFLYGARAGIKFMMVALELNYFRAAHNLELKEFVTFEWGDREIDYSYIGLNFKYFFPFLMVHPYVTFGMGYYSASIHGIDKDRDRGYNFGIGLELHLGRKLSILGEGKYNRVKLDIDEREFKIGDFTISGGINIYF
jgi:hypothetical protein